MKYERPLNHTTISQLLFFLFSEERKLLDDERVLFVQLNWGKDVREGRFLLRKEVRANSKFADQSAHLYTVKPL